MNSGFLVKLAGDGRLDRLSHLDEAGERRIAPRRILRLTAEEDPPFMLCKHDDDRVHPRIMLGLAGVAATGPSAPIGLGAFSADRAKTVATMPVGKAQGRCKQRSVLRVEKAEQCEMRTRVGGSAAIGDVGKTRSPAVQPEEQAGITDGLPR